MVQSKFKSCEELPLFRGAKTVAEVLGISVAGAYELVHQEDFPVLRIGSRLVVPKEKFLAWVEEQTGGNATSIIFESVMQRRKKLFSSAECNFQFGIVSW